MCVMTWRALSIGPHPNLHRPIVPRCDNHRVVRRKLNGVDRAVVPFEPPDLLRGGYVPKEYLLVAASCRQPEGTPGWGKRDEALS
jgi:hypothetical protein